MSFEVDIDGADLKGRVWVSDGEPQRHGCGKTVVQQQLQLSATKIRLCPPSITL